MDIARGVEISGADGILADSRGQDIQPLIVAIPVIPAPYDDQVLPLRENAGNKFHKPAMKITTGYDSEDSIVSSKFSLKLNGLAKLKGSFAIDPLRRQVGQPIIGLFTNRCAVNYDAGQRSLGVALNSRIGKFAKAAYNHIHNFETNEGIGSLFASAHSAEEGYGVGTTFSFPVHKELLSSLNTLRGRKNGDPQPHPPTWLGLTTTVDFPCGRIQHESSTRRDVDSQTSSGLSGHLQVPTGGHGKATAEFSEPERSVDLKYTWKTQGLALTPSLSLPGSDFHLLLKRKFDHAHKLSREKKQELEGGGSGNPRHRHDTLFFFKNLEMNSMSHSFEYGVQHTDWNGWYRYSPTPDLRAKFGHDSSARVTWASFWFGKESAGSGSAPFKCKAQAMVQLHHYTRDLIWLFKIKKRMDFW